jgi:hypothetical protein
MKLTMKVEMEIADTVSMSVVADALSHLLWSLRDDLDKKVSIKDVCINGMTVSLPAKMMWR